jgi:hypothetical protein
VSISKGLRRGLVLATAGALTLLTSGTATAAAAALPPPWSYEGIYNSYSECSRAAQRLDERYGISSWQCTLYGDNDPSRELWVIW